MSLDDYLQDIDMTNIMELKTAIKIYHKKEKVFLFNTYDYYDYIVQILEKNPSINNYEIFNSFQLKHDIYNTFDIIVKELSKDTYLVVDQDLFDDLMKDYFKFINKKQA